MAGCREVAEEEKLGVLLQVAEAMISVSLKLLLYA